MSTISCSIYNICDAGSTSRNFDRDIKSMLKIMLAVDRAFDADITLNVVWKQSAMDTVFLSAGDRANEVSKTH